MPLTEKFEPWRSDIGWIYALRATGRLWHRKRLGLSSSSLAKQPTYGATGELDLRSREVGIQLRILHRLRTKKAGKSREKLDKRLRNRWNGAAWVMVVGGCREISVRMRLAEAKELNSARV